MKPIVLYFPAVLHSMLYIAMMSFLFHLANDVGAEVLQMSEFYKLYSCCKILKSFTYSGRPMFPQVKGDLFEWSAKSEYIKPLFPVTPVTLMKNKHHTLLLTFSPTAGGVGCIVSCKESIKTCVCR